MSRDPLTFRIDLLGCIFADEDRRGHAGRMLDSDERLGYYADWITFGDDQLRWLGPED